MKFSLASLVWLMLYVTTVAAVAGAIVQARRSVMATYGTPQAQAEWDTWRDDAEEMATDAGPVRRRVPESAEPPALVLMRDHFAACLGLAVLLSSILFATFMFFARGAMGTNTFPRTPIRKT